MLLALLIRAKLYIPSTINTRGESTLQLNVAFQTVSKRRLKTCWIKWESGSLYVVWRIEYHWVKSYFHLQHRASLAQTIARQPFIWNETMEEGRSANRNELLSRDGMNFAQQMALGVCHLGRLKTCWIKWESGCLYVVWRTVAIALELLQYSTHTQGGREAIS